MNDKKKNSFIKNNYSKNILYLWEKDILEDLKLCEELTNEYIKNDGNLSNYHSFNYHINEEGSLKLNKEIINPYMDWDFKQLSSIIDLNVRKRVSRYRPDKRTTFNCDYCGAEKTQMTRDYNLSKNHFCSIECAHKYRKGKPLNKRKITV